MIEKFTAYLVSIKGYSKNTARAYEKDLRTFAKYVSRNKQGKRWSTIEQADVDEYVIWLSNTSHKPATLCRHIASISAFYRWLKRSGHDVTNPCKYESRPKIGKREPNTIPVDVLTKTWKRTTGDLHVIVSLLMSTGCRIQEALDIRATDIHIEDRAITLHGKGGKDRRVFISKVLEADLQDMEYQKRGKLFATWTQRQVRWELYNIISKISDVKQASPHAIRHTYATEMARQGANVAQIATLMGHQSVKTTQKYIDMAALGTRDLGTSFEYKQQEVVA